MEGTCSSQKTVNHLDTFEALRAKELRRKVLDFALETGVGHLGGALSAIEILISLYDKILNPEDKFILSKSHACNPFYLLLREKGHNPKIADHCDIDEKNGICCTTGSLGHGLPIGLGMAFARKKLNKNGRIYILIGDGECQEGTIWESADIAAYHKLDNVTVIVDNNEVQALDKIKDVSLMNFKDKFNAFGWHVSEINGHNFQEIIQALNEQPKGKPYVIIAHTIKGKGVSYMENNPAWHGRIVTPEELSKAYEELKND